MATKMKKCNKCNKELGFTDKEGNTIEIIGFSYSKTVFSNINKKELDKQFGIYKDLEEFNLCWECWLKYLGVTMK